MGMSTGGGSGSGGGGPSMLAEINVTPMVDVMLVLLIIFMVTAPLLTVGVPVNLPQTRAEPLSNPDEPIKNGIVYIVKTPFKFGEEFEKALKGNLKLQQEREVYVHADQALPYGDVVKVMATLSRNGGEKIGLVTDPLK